MHNVRPWYYALQSKIAYLSRKMLEIGLKGTAAPLPVQNKMLKDCDGVA